MAEASTSASKIVRGEMGETDSCGISFYCIPDYVCRHPSILPSTSLQNSPEYFSSSQSRATERNVNQSFTPNWHRYDVKLVLLIFGQTEQSWRHHRKARSTSRTSPRTPVDSIQSLAWPLRKACITSKPRIVA